MALLRIQSGPLSWRDRVFWWRRDLAYRVRQMRREPGDTGKGQWTPRREWGGWALRPHRGWRRIRWVTRPLHYTRSIPAGDQLAAAEWGLERLGL